MIIQKKALFREQITLGKIVYFKKIFKLLLRREPRNVEKLSALNRIKLFNIETKRRCQSSYIEFKRKYFSKYYELQK
jgi:hypothetical protein